METLNSDLNSDFKIVSITRRVELPLTIVWDAWTKPESFKKWWGPKGYTCPECSIDLHVGGKNISCMLAIDGKEFWSTGTYEEIIPMKKLIYKDSFSDKDGTEVDPSFYGMPGNWGDVIVTVLLEEIDGKIRMRMTQTGIPEEMYDDCIIGWQESLDKLETNLKE